MDESGSCQARNRAAPLRGIGRPRGAAATIASLVLVLAIPGCASWQKRRALEAVARDWCYTIRASQVLPVYPLSEDVQPGDLYLVQLPIDRQQEAYKDNGFLPFDNLLARLKPSGYEGFYRDSFKLGTATAPLPESLVRGDGSGWTRAPAAAFPSYAFSVRSGAGAKIAIPVNGVPVGLSLLNSDAAEGSIAISDVRTYGVDTLSLLGDVLAWSEQNSAFLKDFAPSPARRWGIFPTTRQNYLRVVSRVYVTRKVSVSLTDSSAQSAQADVGVPKTIQLFEAATGADPQQATSKNYEQALGAVNSAIEKALETGGGMAPGGSLKVVAASSRSITMEETFPKPLAIGYLGFDLAIGADGSLGPPMPTYAVLAKNEQPSREPLTYDEDASRSCIEAWLRGRDRDQMKERVLKVVKWWTARGLPEPNKATLKIKSREYRNERLLFMAENEITCS